MDIAEPVACWHAPAFSLHPTLASMQGAALIRPQVVQERRPGAKRRLAAIQVMKALHGEHFGRVPEPCGRGGACTTTQVAEGSAGGWEPFLCLFSQKERPLHLKMRRYDHSDRRPSAPHEQGPSEKKGYTGVMIGNPRLRGAQRRAIASRTHEHDWSTGHAWPLLRVCGIHQGTIPHARAACEAPRPSPGARCPALTVPSPSTELSCGTYLANTLDRVPVQYCTRHKEVWRWHDTDTPSSSSARPW